MKFILDSDICIFILRRKFPKLLNEVSRHPFSAFGISIFTLAELYSGVYTSTRKEENEISLKHFLHPFEIIHFNENMAQTFGQFRADIEKKGKPIGALDLLIASQAKELDLTIITNNEREFNRIPELKIENWLK